MEVIKPTLRDVESMQRLVKPYVEEGIILARSDDEVASTIRSYMVVKKQEEILGFASLFIYTHEFAEVRSLAVAKKHQRNGVGSAVVKALIEEGRKLGLRQILTLTYHSDFFKRLGFKEVAKEEVWHHKVWEDCIKCRHFPVCDELALILNL